MGLFKKLGNMATLGLFKGVGANPADSAMPYLNKIPAVGEKYYNPYIQQGQQSQQTLEPIYNQLAKDPSAFLNQLMQNYTASNGYNYRKNEYLKGARNSAAQGGFSGTDFDQKQQMEGIHGLLGQDMQQYLSNILGLQGAGIAGLEGQTGRGFEASGNLADYLGSNLGQQATLAYQGQAQRNQLRSDKRNALMNLLGQLGGAAMGGATGGASSAGRMMQQQSQGYGGNYGGGGAWNRLGQGSRFGGGY